MKKESRVVHIILPVKNKVCEVEVQHDELESFIGKSMVEMRYDWNKSFSDPYVYKESGRHKFLERIGKTR